MKDHIMNVAVSAYRCLTPSQRKVFAVKVVEEEEKKADHDLLCLIREYHTTCLGELEFRQRIRKLACKKVDESVHYVTDLCGNGSCESKEVKQKLEEM